MGDPAQVGIAERVLGMLAPAAPADPGVARVVVPLSALVAVVRSGLARDPFFPPAVRPGDLGDGAVIERRGRHLFLVHERSEVGQLRYSDLSCRRYFFLRGAVLRYLRHYRSLLRVRGVQVQRWSWLPLR